MVLWIYISVLFGKITICQLRRHKLAKIQKHISNTHSSHRQNIENLNNRRKRKRNENIKCIKFGFVLVLEVSDRMSQVKQLEERQRQIFVTVKVRKLRRKFSHSISTINECIKSPMENVFWVLFFSHSFKKSPNRSVNNKYTSKTMRDTNTMPFLR